MQNKLGFYHRLRHNLGLYGITEAERGLLGAIIAYSSWDKIVLWTDSRKTQTISSPKVELRPAELLSSDLDKGFVDAVQHVGIGPAVFEQARRNRPVPVFTSVFPALSYNHQAKDHIIEILSQKTSRDVNIFPSKCSMDVYNDIQAALCKNGLVSNGKAKGEVIPIGVDIDMFAPCTSFQKREIRDKEKLPNSAIIAVVVSRFSPSDKADIFPLIYSIKSSLDEKAKELVFLFAGGDNYFGAKKYIKCLTEIVYKFGLQKQIAIRVTDDRLRLVNLIRCSDIFVSPSDSVQETFGITPLEAMSAGLPAIVSDWNGYRETVINGRTGFLAKTVFFNNQDIWNAARYYSDFRFQHLILGQSIFVDTVSLIKKCCELSAQRDLLAEMSLAATTHIRENYSWENVILRYENIWGASLNSSSQFITDSFFSSDLSYFSIFKRYATNVSNDNDVFRLTSFGRDVYNGKLVPVAFSELSAFLDLGCVCLMFKIFDNTDLSVCELISHLGDFDENIIRFCLSWMVKNNILVAI